MESGLFTGLKQRDSDLCQPQLQGWVWPCLTNPWFPWASFKFHASGLLPFIADKRKSLGQAVLAKNTLHVTQFTAMLKQAFHLIDRTGITLELSLAFLDTPPKHSPSPWATGNFSFSCGWDSYKGWIFLCVLYWTTPASTQAHCADQAASALLLTGKMLMIPIQLWA